MDFLKRYLGIVSSLETLFAAARSLEYYPHSAAHLVCVSMSAQGFDTLRQLVNGLSDIELRRMNWSLDKCHLDDSLYEVMLGERVLGLLELQHPLEFLEYLATDEAEEARRLTRRQADDLAQVVPFVRQRDTWGSSCATCAKSWMLHENLFPNE